jgi:hypothetical protein
MTRTDYVIFWADDHSPVRILPMRLEERQTKLGGQIALALNAYARHLRDMMRCDRVTWEATNDCKSSYPALLAKDMAEYRAWLESQAATV